MISHCRARNQNAVQHPKIERQNIAPAFSQKPGKVPQKIPKQKLAISDLPALPSFPKGDKKSRLDKAPVGKLSAPQTDKKVVTFTSANPPTTPVAGFATEHVVGKRKSKPEPKSVAKPLATSKNAQQAKSKNTIKNTSKATGALLNKKKKK